MKMPAVLWAARRSSPDASPAPATPEMRPESGPVVRLYQPDHGALLAPGRGVPVVQGRRGSVATERLDAVAVPAARDAENLEEAAKVARRAGRMLIVLCSHECRGADVRRRLAQFEPRVPVLIVDLAEYAFPHRSRTLEWTRRTGWTGNTALKRNVALLLARRLGLRHVLFLDDDVRKVDTGQVKSSVAAVEAGVHRAAGWRFADFPDNSAVSHAYRRLERPPFGKQGCFIGGGGLLVRIDDEVPHFPMGIYNEDWLFLVPLLVRRQVKLLGSLKQVKYDPFRKAENAQIQEFGDLVAEALMTLIAEREPGEDLTADLASLDFWRGELDRRTAFLKDLEKRLLAENAERRASRPRPKVEWGGRHPEEVLDAVRSAAEVLGGIRPRDVVAWIGAWQADAKGWQRLWVRLGADRPDDPARQLASAGLVRGRIQEMLDEMGLTGRVEYLWPAASPLPGAGGLRPAEPVEEAPRPDLVSHA